MSECRCGGGFGGAPELPGPHEPGVHGCHVEPTVYGIRGHRRRTPEQAAQERALMEELDRKFWADPKNVERVKRQIMEYLGEGT